jgi:hypothetical protein
LNIAAINFKSITDIKIIYNDEIRYFENEFFDVSIFVGGHAHYFPGDYIKFLMFFYVLLYESHHFELKLYLFLLILSFEQGDVGLATFDNELLNEFDINDKSLLDVFYLDEGY